MSKWFSLYVKPWNISCEWQLFKGGYFALSRRGLTIMQRFATWGRPDFGTQKEFTFRFHVELEKVDRSSVLLVELLNLHEARLFYVIVRLWEKVVLSTVLNLGPRLTKASREFAVREVMYQEMKLRRAAAIAKQGGNKDAAIIRPDSGTVPLRRTP